MSDEWIDSVAEMGARVSDAEAKLGDIESDLVHTECRVDELAAELAEYKLRLLLLEARLGVR